MKTMLTAFFAVILGTQSLLANDYWVTQYRAAPGKFPELLELVKNTDWLKSVGSKPVLMRHSQGDQWDLLILGQPCTLPPCVKAGQEFGAKTDALVDFELSFMAKSDTAWDTARQMADAAGLFHIEMFKAAAGKHAALDRQRKIENTYLAKTGQTTNVVFDVQFGSDIDIFTIGFHESLASFAKDAPVTSEQAEAAAIEAGFKNRADISFHLRELIVGHHDTLAVPVK